jgi:hypothetical protein
MATDRNAKLRNLISGYNDSIRLSDLKANIAVLFAAIMMGTVIQYKDLYPHYLSLPVLIVPFLFIFFNLLVSVYPRFPHVGRDRFPVRRRINPEDFDFVGDSVRDLETLPDRCAMFSRILWWKNITLQTAYVTSMALIIVSGALLFIARL